jgi:CRP-like cAMP-binding protein
MISNVANRGPVLLALWRWLDQVRDREQLQRLDFLARVPLFAGLSRRQIGRLAARFYAKTYPAGETVFVEGEPGKALFIVFKGRVGIWRATTNGEEMLAGLDPGAYFGELALIDDEPRFASARAEEPTVLLVLYKTDFDHVIEGQSRIAIHVMSNLLKTLAAYVRRDESRQRNRTGVSLHNSDDHQRKDSS